MRISTLLSIGLLISGSSAISIKEAREAGQSRTNAQRFARGLPPLAPRRFKQNAVYKRVQASPRTLPSFQGTLQITTAGGSTTTTLSSQLDNQGYFARDTSQNQAQPTLTFAYSGYETNSGAPIYTVTSTPLTTDTGAAVTFNRLMLATDTAFEGLLWLTPGDQSAPYSVTGSDNSIATQYRNSGHGISEAENLTFLIDPTTGVVSFVVLRDINGGTVEQTGITCLYTDESSPPILTPFVTTNPSGCAAGFTTPFGTVTSATYTLEL